MAPLCFVNAQSYMPDAASSRVTFVIKNFGIKTKGSLSGLKGTVVFNPKNLQTSQFNVSVSASTINTDNGTRDKHLKKSEYFDVEKYPTISFVSTKITESTNTGRYYVFGNLTIKGVTKAIQFGFSAAANNTGYIFNGEFEINRRDFGVGSGSVSLSDNLKVMLEVVTTK